MVQEQLPRPDQIRREELNSLFLGKTEHVYFQPPSTEVMQYPCIRYKWNDTDTVFSDNIPYLQTRRYEVIVIDEEPDSDIANFLLTFPMCLHERTYPADNLNHYVFNLFY